MSVFAATTAARKVHQSAPGIYALRDDQDNALGQVRMDIAAFVGVAPRGPARAHKIADTDCFSMDSLINNWSERHRTVPIKVRSWEQYLQIFGAFESPGRLPYALANFFEQGGKEAYVCRIVHDYGDPIANLDAVASTSINNVLSAGVGINIQADNEGKWGNELSIAAGYSFIPIEFDQTNSGLLTLVLNQTQGVQSHHLLRCINDDLSAPANNFAEYRFVSQVNIVEDALSPISQFAITLDAPLPAKASRLQLVSLNINVFDKVTKRFERHTDLAFAAQHQQFVGRVLLVESMLVNPVLDWLNTDLLPISIDPFDQDLRRFCVESQFETAAHTFSHGYDRYEDIVHEDFFDASWVDTNDEHASGIHSLALKSDCALLSVPDLYVPEPFERISRSEPEALLSNAVFAPCFSEQAQFIEPIQQAPTLAKLLLNPENQNDLAIIIQLQQRIARFTDHLQSMIALLDVPPTLSESQIMQWRARFNHAYCACYHPWLKVNQYDADGEVVSVLKVINPSAVAAGIIANTERQKGISFGPANQIAQAVYALQLQVTQSFHDQAHPQGINIFRQQSDGIYLSAARTMNLQTQWRQLSVVRLMTMLKKMLNQQMQWLVFEPNNASLWSKVEFTLDAFLRQLYRSGSFAGESPEHAFFVRCDETTNPPQIVDKGQLVTLIGVAPVQPLEFIVLRLSRDADGTLSIVSN